MDKYYYELVLDYRDDDTRSLIVEFITELTNEALELQNDKIIVRNTSDLDEVEFALKKYIEGISKILGKDITYGLIVEKKENIDWIEKYKSSIQPIKIEPFYIRPSWVKSKENLIDVIIDPALAFGSGHHDSTASILGVLGKYISQDTSVLDVGCGSGILAISAGKLGAIVDICDTDELSIISSKENFATNNVDINREWIGSADKASSQYDIVIANIIADVILLIKKDLIKCMKPQSKLIISGILNQYNDRITDKFQDLKLIEKIQTDEWSTFIYERNN